MAITVAISTKWVVNYDSNNSGGRWWLKDEDWFNLEKAGWVIAWIRLDPSPDIKVDEDGRWLRTLARKAFLIVEASSQIVAEGIGIESFEQITGQDVNSEGCSTCGSPHYFYAESMTSKLIDTLKEIHGISINLPINRENRLDLIED